MKFKKALLLLSTLTMLASCSSSSYFGRYYFLMGKDKPNLPHFKMELNLTDQVTERPTTEETITFSPKVEEPVRIKTVGEKLKLTLEITSKSPIIDENVHFFTSDEEVASFGSITAGEEKEVLSIYYKTFTAELTAKKIGQGYFSASYNNIALVTTDNFLFSIGDCLVLNSPKESTDPFHIGDSLDVEITLYTEKTDVKLSDFSLIISEEKLLQGKLDAINPLPEGSEKGYKVTGTVTATDGGQVYLTAGYNQNTLISQSKSFYITPINELMKANANEKNEQKYYSFTFLLENTMDSQSETGNKSFTFTFNGGYLVKEDGELALDIFSFGEVVLPTEILNAVVKFKLITNAVAVTVPVSENDLLKQIEYVLKTGKTDISPDCKTVTLELAKG